MWIVFILPLLLAAACHRGGPSTGPLPTESLYQLGSVWSNQDGNEVPLSSLRGKVRILTLAFTSCSYSCPVTMRDLLRLDAEIPGRWRNSLGIVYVTLDPERDDPARFRQFLREQKLDPGTWTFLQGTEAATRELAVALDFRVRRLTNGDLSHTAKLLLLDAEGRIVREFVGTQPDPNRS